MRNLKKFLALVLAFMMAMSLMVSASAVTANVVYSDSESVTDEFVEDLTVLSGMGVIKGYDDGTFLPGREINRGQMAAIIYRITTGDVTDSRADYWIGYNPFPDVHDDDYYAGYIGYCASAGYIQGFPDGTFKPMNNVTGYQALAMILRAMGYNHDGDNFTGSNWQSDVSSRARQNNMLVNIQKTIYNNTFGKAATRELVAEMTFQGLVNPQVQWTTAFGYQPYGMVDGVVGSQKNPTLGEEYFGLTNTQRIVVGNQETGENCTVLGADKNGTFTYKTAADPTKVVEVNYTMYAYPGGLYKVDTAAAPGADDVASVDDVYYPNFGLKINAETSLELFGHKLDVWYDARDNGVHNTYAFFDRAASVLIKDDADPAGGTVLLAPAAKAEGLTLNDSVHLSQSFSRIEDQSINGKPAKSFVASPEELYILIDNTGNKVVDVIIPLNVQTSKITAVDNVSSVKTVQAPMDTTVPAFDVDKTTNWNGETTNNALIEQDALVGKSTTTLGDYEIGIRVNGTKYDDAISFWSATETYSYVHNHPFDDDHEETALYRLTKVDKSSTGRVISFNDDDGIVILDTGVTLERSLFYDTVAGNNYTTAIGSPAPSTALPQSWQPGQTYWKEGYTNGTYRFYLDADGKYLGAERVQDLDFIYGTYMDYDQVTSSSSFNYYVTGVDLNGEIVKQQQVTLFNGTPVSGTDQIGIPFRDTFGQNGGTPGTPIAMNGIGTGQYIGMTVNDTTLNSTKTSLDVIGVYQGTDTASGIHLSTLTIRSGDVSLGAKATDPATDTVGAQNSNGNMYFTNNTKFILVSGYGTDSVNADVYDGIGDLLGNASAVHIDFDAQNSALADGPIPHITATTTMEAMTYLTQSDFVYAQSQGNLAKQVNTIILPADAVTWVTGSNLYYVGNPAATLWNGNTTGNKATQFTMYKDGEAQNIWVQGLSYEAAGVNNTAADVAASSDTFWQLEDTGLKTNSGDPIYAAGSYGTTTVTATTFYRQLPYALPVTGDAMTDPAVYNTGNGNMAHLKYFATTYDSQVALVGNVLKNVGSAKIVNLNTTSSPDITAGSPTATSGYVWPGITDLTTLNNAGSVAGSGAYAAQNLYVSVVYNSTGAISVIYVCWDQNATP